jgi:hypothetical protein
MRSEATSVSGLTLLVYAALSYWCMRPYAASVCRLQLLVYAALRYYGMRPYATIVCGFTLLVDARGAFAAKAAPSDLSDEGTSALQIYDKLLLLIRLTDC